MTAAALMIRGAALDGRLADVRIEGGKIAAIAPALQVSGADTVIEAAGGALLPGLHDHHIHLNATAAALASVRCGPPQVTTPQALADALRATPGQGWVRGVGYHPSVGVELDRAWLDRHGPERPVRVQHRSGRQWVLNGLALAALGGDLAADGRLLDNDGALQTRLRAPPPYLYPVGRQLAAWGVSGLTEATVRNDADDYRRYADAGLPQRLTVMGRPAVWCEARGPRIAPGPLKLHYHDHDLPPLDGLTAEVGQAHAMGRPVASHCVTRAELILTLAAIEAAGAMPGDRIEHGAIVDPDAADWIAALGLTVVSQPHFLVERGAAYRTDVAADDRPWLYRLAGLKRAGVKLAGGTDAPFGGLDPWAAMAAAVDRPEGFGEGEAVSPEAALALFTTAADDPGGPPRRVEVGIEADLCLLDRPWRSAREDLAAVRVQATLVGGEVVHRTADVGAQSVGR